MSGTSRPVRPRIRLLGPVCVSERHRITPLPVGAAGAIFARLALQPKVCVPTAQLIELVWADEPPATAHHAIAVYVSVVRARLGGHRFIADALAGSRAGYMLDVDEDDVDALLLLRAAESAAASGAQDPEETLGLLRRLWKGSPLAGLTGRFPALEPSAQALDQARSRLALAAARAMLRDGDLERSTMLLHDLHQSAPTNEAATLLLMQSLADAGRRDAALEVYRTGARALTQAGLPVSDPLRRAQRALAANDPLLMPDSAAGRPGHDDRDQRLAEVVALATDYAVFTRLPTSRRLTELQARHGEIVYALSRCESEKRWESLLSLALALRAHWWIGGYLIPGLRWLLLALRHTRAATDDQRRLAHYYVAQLALATGNLPVARTSAAKASDFARLTDDRLAEAWTLLLRAAIDGIDGKPRDCRKHLAQAQQHFADYDDSAGMAAARSALARERSRSNDSAAAISLASQAVAIAAATGQPRVRGEAELARAVVLGHAGATQEAGAAARRAAEAALACGDRLLLPRALLLLAASHEDRREADRLTGIAAAIVTATGAQTPHDSIPTAMIHPESWKAGWLSAMAHPHAPSITIAELRRR